MRFSVHAGFLRRHAAPHVLDDGMRAADLDVLFAVAGRARRAYILIYITARADDGRIAGAPRQFPGEPTGRRRA